MEVVDLTQNDYLAIGTNTSLKIYSIDQGIVNEKTSRIFNSRVGGLAQKENTLFVAVDHVGIKVFDLIYLPLIEMTSEVTTTNPENAFYTDLSLGSNILVATSFYNGLEIFNVSSGSVNLVSEFKKDTTFFAMNDLRMHYRSTVISDAKVVNTEFMEGIHVIDLSKPGATYLEDTINIDSTDFHQIFLNYPYLVDFLNQDLVASFGALLVVIFDYNFAPTAPIITNYYSPDKGAIYLEWTSSTDLDGNISEYKIKLYDNDTGEYLQNVYVETTNYTLEDLNTGKYTLQVEAIDNNGKNGAPSNSVTIQVFGTNETTTEEENNNVPWNFSYTLASALFLGILIHAYKRKHSKSR